MKETTEKWLYYLQWFTITVGVLFVLFLSSSAEGVDNKTINEPQFTERGFPKILDDDKWASQLIYDTIGACYQGTIRWILLSNPALLNQIPSPLAQRQMVEHCFCVMDKVRKDFNYQEYIKKISDMDWGGSLFMSKALECVGEYQTLQSFFQIPDDKTKTDSETKIDNETIIKPDKPKDSQDEPPGQNPKEFNGLPETLFQG